MATEKAAYSVAEFCAAFPIKKSKLYELLAAGEIVARKSGRKTLIEAEEAARWLSSLPAYQSNAEGNQAVA